MRIIPRLLIVSALLGGSLAAGLVRPAAADAIVNGIQVAGSGVPPGVTPGQPVEPVRPMNLVFIDFDDASQPCVFIDTTALRDAYQALGVRFSGPGALDGGAILNQCGNFGVSGYSAPNFVAFNADASMLHGGVAIGPERMTFTYEVSTLQVGVAAGSGAGLAILKAYDAFLQPLATASAPATALMQTLSVAVPGIRYADLDVVGNNVWVFDNLAFDISPTGTARPTWGRIKALYR